jgi:hypothetical protein
VENLRQIVATPAEDFRLQMFQGVSSPFATRQPNPFFAFKAIGVRARSVRVFDRPEEPDSAPFEQAVSDVLANHGSRLNTMRTAND